MEARKITTSLCTERAEVALEVGKTRLPANQTLGEAAAFAVGCGGVFGKQGLAAGEAALGDVAGGFEEFAVA